MKTLTIIGFWLLSCLSPISAQEARPQFPWKFIKVSSLQTEISRAGISELRSAGIDGEGNVSFTSSRRLAIHQFDADGSWKGNLGTSGNGPGEFRATQLVSVTFDGELLVYDGLNGRKLSHFDSNGEYLYSFADLLDGWVEGFHIISRNTYIISSITIPFLSAERLRTVKLRDRVGNILWSMKFEMKSPNLELITESAIMGLGPNPAAQDVLWAVDPHSVTWILTLNQNELICIDSEGNELSSTKTIIPPLLLSRSDWRQFVEDKFNPYINIVEPRLREDYISLRDDLLKARDNLRSIQRLWWVGSEGLLADRNVYQPDTVKHWALVPGRYAALLPDGRLSEEVEGPG